MAGNYQIHVHDTMHAVTCRLTTEYGMSSVPLYSTTRYLYLYLTFNEVTLLGFYRFVSHLQVRKHNNDWFFRIDVTRGCTECT